VAQVVLPLPVRAGLLGLLVLVGIGCDAKVLPFRLPQNARQVPSGIIVRADGAGALQFGFEMGTGLRTFMPTHMPHVLAGLALLVVPWWAAPLLGACFAAGRVIMVHSAVRLGDATAWDIAFARRRRLIYVACWVSILGGLAVIASTMW
jgi:hypothetical protein